MDFESLYVLHMCMLDHMRRLNMHQSAAIFAREAGISNGANGLNLHDGFLGDWFSMFWDCYNLKMYDTSINEGMVESSAQAEARAQAQAQAQGHAEAKPEVNALSLVQAQSQVQAHAYSEDWSLVPSFSQLQAQAHVEDWSLVPSLDQGGAQAQAHTQDQAHAIANDAMLTLEPYVYGMGQASTQQFPFNIVGANIPSQPLLAAIPIWTDEQQSVLPCYTNLNVQQGLASPEPSRNSRQNRSNPAQTSRRSLRRASRARSQLRRGNTSNATSTAQLGL